MLLDPERPMTLRHLFYLLVSKGLIENDGKRLPPPGSSDRNCEAEEERSTFRVSLTTCGPRSNRLS